jgi:hypothetical protein
MEYSWASVPGSNRLSLSADSTNRGLKILGNNCICIEHIQIFFLSLFPKQYRIITVCNIYMELRIVSHQEMI